MTRQQLFTARTRALIAEARAMGPLVRRQILEMLDAARKQILAQLLDLDPERFQAAQLRALKLSIDQLFAEFAANAEVHVHRQQEKAFDVGVRTAGEPLAAIALEAAPMGRVSRSSLGIAQAYTADLITGLSKDAAAKVNAAIQRAFLGGQPLDEIVKQIGRALGGGKFDGAFGPIGERAQGIAVNEILRVHSMATQARLEDAFERHPDLMKQWYWIPAAKQPRIYHQQFSGTAVKVNEPFEVAGEKLMYPRDPAGSPWNTINCHCLMRPYFMPEALKPTPAHKGLLDQLGIQVQVTAA